MQGFLKDDFLLQTKTARVLYNDFASQMPIYDYHCHLPVKDIAEDRKFDNLTQIWLAGDHYKWRAMRTNGVDERCITGDASDHNKFMEWAKTVPYCIRNPLYHWTHLELKKPFGISNTVLNGESAEMIYDACSEMLRTPEFSVRNIMRKANVKLVCTTEGPADSLDWHQKIREDGFEIKVHTAYRPDKALAAEDLPSLNSWFGMVGELSGIEIKDWQSFLDAFGNRHDYFHNNGCRLSDYGLETAYAESYTEAEIKSIFDKILSCKELSAVELLKYKSAVLYEFALMDSNAGWVLQLHLGALRNNNSRMMRTLGADTGFDSIGDFEIARPLSKFLDKLDSNNKLPKTVLYNLNPRDNELMATMLGNFQDGSVAGKLQYGSGWWFLDQKDGMEKQINALSNLGLLSRFIGMLTDSRSFLSYSRHEYFRRILCNMLGNDVENGLIPNDITLLGKMVEDISYNNARNYFEMDCE